MRVIQDDLWLCTDCTLLAVNGDATSLDYHYGKDAAARLAAIEAGLTRLGPHLVSGDDTDESSSRRCDCCETRLAGARHEFAVLGNDTEEGTDA